ncbi:hypothetical protein ACSQ67_025946 [Phaseolus vulgaris]
MLPASIGLLSELEVLLLDENHLEGDLTESHVSNFSKLSYYIGNYTLNISLMWKGVEQGFQNPELKLKSIDLSSNKLTGNLRSLDFLDLSRNNLTGQIPSSLSQIDGMGKLDLSHNSLSGRIPSGRHFETFDRSSFEGNNDLCGEQVIADVLRTLIDL